MGKKNFERRLLAKGVKEVLGFDADASHEKQAEQAADIGKEVMENERVREFVNSAVEYIDDTKAMGVIQEMWDKVPDSAQGIVMRMLPNGNPIEVLTRVGLLENKTAKSEEELAAISGKPIAQLEFIVKYGKYVQPELKALEPFIEPLKMVQGAQEGVFADARAHLAEVRQERKDQEDIQQAREQIADL